MAVYFTAVRRFDPASGDLWSKYIAWSGLTHLKEVVSLDEILCPAVVQELIDEDWQYNVHEDNKIFLFHDLDYLLGRVAGEERVNVLAIMENPTAADMQQFADSRFNFCGFDMIERQGSISALVMRGFRQGLLKKIHLSECGLVTDRLSAGDSDSIPAADRDP